MTCIYMSGHFFVRKFLKEIENHRSFNFVFELPSLNFVIFANFRLFAFERFALLKGCVAKVIKSN